MSSHTAGFDIVRKIALELPEVEESATWGSPTLKVRGKLLACVAINKSAEPGSLMVRIDLDQRDALLAEAPAIYYVTDHYLAYPSVLVRLSRIPADQLRDLLRAAWKFVTAEKRRAPSPAKAKAKAKAKPAARRRG